MPLRLRGQRPDPLQSTDDATDPAADLVEDLGVEHGGGSDRRTDPGSQQIDPGGRAAVDVAVDGDQMGQGASRRLIGRCVGLGQTKAPARQALLVAIRCIRRNAAGYAD